MYFWMLTSSKLHNTDSHLTVVNLLLFFLQNSFSSVFHMEYEELGEALDISKR